MKKRVFLTLLTLVCCAASSLAALLLVNPTYPKINYSSTVSNAVNYTASSGLFSVTAQPSSVNFSSSQTKLMSGTRSLQIGIIVDNTGALVGGVSGDDLVVSGTVTGVVGGVTNTYSGVLLTGEVTAFGFLENGGSDLYDFRFRITGGAMASLFCEQICVSLVSDNSTFTGSFNTNFMGRAKNLVGAEDVTPPMITCPSDIIAECHSTNANGLGGAYMSYPTPVVTDNCDPNPTVTCTPPSGSFFALPPAPANMTNYVIACVARDASGNTNTCTFNITVEDTLPPEWADTNNPVIYDDLVHPIMLTNDPGYCYATFTFQDPMAIDNCCPLTILASVSAIDQHGATILLTTNVGNGMLQGQFPVTCTGSNVVTVTADDGRGNTSQHQVAILVVDNQPPEINCPTNQIVECTGGQVFFEEPILSDNCPNVTDSCTPTNGSVMGVGPHAIVCTATDCSGNTNQCSFYVTVQDTTPPTISCPTNVTVECGQATAPSSTGMATASDTCDSSPTVTSTDAVSGNCPGTITRTWTATDYSGNSNSCAQIITIQDTAAPVISSVPAGSSLGCNPASLPTDASVKALVTATDNCGSVTVTVTHVDAGTACAPTRTFTITATDGCGNVATASPVVYTWTADTTPPTVTVPAGGDLGCSPTNLPTDVSLKALVTASDNCSAVTTTVTHVDSTTNCVASRTFTVTAKDACNNSTTRTVVYTYGCAPCVPSTFNFQGNTALSGAFGNVRTFITNGVSVKVTAFSRTTNGTWATAYLGSYTGGLGVTDTSEADGSNNRHTIDNIDRNNYVLFEFSQPVVLDRAFLGYVVTDSDLKLWIGTFANPFSNHLTLSDAVLSSFGFTENNDTTTNATRWADLNAGGVMGNAIVIAASTNSITPNDQFKVALFDICTRVCQPLTLGCAASTGKKGVAYSSTLPASGGTPAYTFSINSGSLPAGLTLNTNTGAITGTPTTAGAYTYTAKVKDSLGATALSSGCSITIASPLTIGCAASTGTKGVAYSSTLPASGGTAPYTFSIYSGSLPAGLTLNTTTGAITGTPTSTGTCSYTAKVKDSLGATALSSGCSIVISK